MQLDFRKAPQILGDIVDAMAIGVFTVNAKGEFVAWSQGAERITGYSEAEVLGRRCELLEGPNCKGFATLAELLRAPLTSAPPGICSQECKLMSRDDREIYIHGSMRLLRDEQERVVGAVGTFMDMTSFVLANEKIALLEKQASPGDAFARMIGHGTAMKEVFRRVRLAADSDITVLLTGESGTGKELAAAAIHSESSRHECPFLAVNCSAIPDALLESELFGHVKGAFTGAVRDKLGLFEAAEGGTLFLDEIGDVSPTIQVKLLRALQEREVRRVGDETNRPVNVRLVTATNRDLPTLVAKGTIREDFYYRVNVFPIQLPPLRGRREDIPLLIEHFIQQISRESGKNLGGIARDAMQAMLRCDWPGNIRQLRNAIEHASVSASSDRISLYDLPPEVRQPRRPTASETQANWTSDEQAERERIVDALRQTGANRTQAAKLLGFSRVTLWKKIGRYEIDVSRVAEE